MITFETELARIRGIPPKFIGRFARLGLRTVKDLLFHFPARYEDFSAFVPIADLELNQSTTVRGMIQRIDTRRTWRKRMVLVEAVIRDESGSIKAVWFNQPFLTRVLRPGAVAHFAGKVAANDDELYLSNPAYEFIPRGTSMRTPNHTGRLVPVYPETRGLTSRGIRYLVRPLLEALGTLPDFIPAPVCARNNLPSLHDALHAVHFPQALPAAERARTRFAFADLFLLQLNNLKRRAALSREHAPAIAARPEELEGAIAALPFTLTPSQRACVEAIIKDLEGPAPMNRLLQGDVGSGKTVVAALAAYAAALSGAQAAFMAPTEVLARQHYRTLTRVFDRIARREPLRIGLLVSKEARTSRGQEHEEKLGKERLLAAVAAGDVSILIGTHALIERSVSFRNLAFVVVDEQHRFGVEQRARLAAQNRLDGPAGRLIPHFLSMSATPIPRTLSLTLFGDLDLSTITELPGGRKPIITKIVRPEERDAAYGFIRSEVKRGRQVFVICPRIEPPETQINADNAQMVADNDNSLRESAWWEVKAVKDEYEKLSQHTFPDLRVGMLHGKMKSAEKAAVMHAFSAGELSLLVSTSVIEVGIDVPNASIMVIEGADRFGLSQLYQFRGRVGRGEHQSYCFLFTDSSSAAVRERLQALMTAKNGFELAERDLSLRGPGQFLGERQTGLPDLAMRALENIPLIRSARAAAEDVLKTDPNLARAPLLREELKRFEARLHLE